MTASICNPLGCIGLGATVLVVVLIVVMGFLGRNP